MCAYVERERENRNRCKKISIIIRFSWHIEATERLYDAAKNYYLISGSKITVINK